jgi:hypothetical protein
MRSLPEVLVSLAVNIVGVILWLMVHGIAVYGALKLLGLMKEKEQDGQDGEGNFWLGWVASLLVLLWFYSRD